MFSIECHEGRDIQEVWDIVSVPSRGLCFQSRMAERLGIPVERRFRPLSGIMFSILILDFGKKPVFIVSVPSRGLCFQSNMYTLKVNTLLEFPSPLGDYVFNHRQNEKV